MSRITIWVEDDATAYHMDHETLDEAYKRIYGENLDYTKAILVADLGNAREYTFWNGAIVFATFPGQTAIYEEAQ